MQQQSRTRRSIWSKEEERLLMREFVKHRDVLRPCSALAAQLVSPLEKREVWEKIAAAVNQLGHFKRDGPQCRKKYENMTHQIVQKERMSNRTAVSGQNRRWFPGNPAISVAGAKQRVSTTTMATLRPMLAQNPTAVLCSSLAPNQASTPFVLRLAAKPSNSGDIQRDCSSYPELSQSSHLAAALANQQGNAESDLFLQASSLQPAVGVLSTQQGYPVAQVKIEPVEELSNALIDQNLTSSIANGCSNNFNEASSNQYVLVKVVEEDQQEENMTTLHANDDYPPAWPNSDPEFTANSIAMCRSTASEVDLNNQDANDDFTQEASEQLERSASHVSDLAASSIAESAAADAAIRFAAERHRAQMEILALEKARAAKALLLVEEKREYVRLKKAFVSAKLQLFRRQADSQTGPCSRAAD